MINIILNQFKSFIHGRELAYELELDGRLELDARLAYELGLDDRQGLVCVLELDDKLEQACELELGQRILHKIHRQRNQYSDQPYSLHFGAFRQEAKLNNVR